MAECAPVSVIIPCYRCAGVIEAAVASVAAQTLPAAQVILVDDASGDETAALLQTLAQRFASGWLQVFTLPTNSGPAVARNTGWAQATQPYIAFLDADDAWHPDKLRMQYGLMAQHPELALTGHAAWEVDAPPVTSPTAPSDSAHDEPPWRILTQTELFAGNPFVTPSVMLRSTLPQRFNPQLRYCEDFMLWLEVGMDGAQVAFVEAPLVYVRRAAGHAGLSRNEYRMRLGFARAYVELWRSGRVPFTLAARRSSELYAKAVLFRLLGPSLHRRAKARVQGS